MNEESFLKRKIILKEQAIKLIHGEIKALEDRLALLHFRNSVLEKMGWGIDRELSQELDCIDFLLRQ